MTKTNIMKHGYKTLLAVSLGILCMVILSQQVNAAIAFDAVSTACCGTGTPTTLTWNHTVTGTNTILIVATYNVGNNTISSVTYNSIGLTKMGSDLSSGGDKSSIWYLVNPSTGTHNVVVTAGAGSSGIQADAISYTGTAQAAPEVNQGNTGTTNAYADTLTTLTDNAWHIAWGHSSPGYNITAGSNTTLRNSSNNSNFLDTNSAVTPAGSNTLNINFSGTGAITVFGLSIAPFAATSTSSSTNYYTQLMSTTTDLLVQGFVIQLQYIVDTLFFLAAAGGVFMFIKSRK